MKTKSLVYTFSFLFSIITLKSTSQEFCGTEIIHEQRMQTDSLYRNHFINLEQQIKNRILNLPIYSPNGTRNLQTPVYTVPVVVHVIHLGESVGTGTNLSDAQIQGAIDGLNDRFRNQIGNGVDVQIEFCLASRDSVGNSTNGIDRIDGSSYPNYSTQGFGCGGSPIDTIQIHDSWPPLDYYNIWVVNMICGGQYAGLASFPSGWYSDGTIIDYRVMTYSSLVLAHELGHGFSLYHTFDGGGGSCAVDTSCLDEGDRVCDTPPHKQADCGITNPCTSVGIWDNSRYNYLSYCFPSQPNGRFTQGQKDRIRATAVTFPRSNLLTSLGCTPVSAYDAAITEVFYPITTTYTSHCTFPDSISPIVYLKNFSLNPLTSVTINYKLDNDSLRTYSWSGNLPGHASIKVNLPSLSIFQGNHTFLSFTSDPNGLPDDYDLNDSSNVEFKYIIAQPFTLKDSVINETCYNSNDGSISVNPIPKTEIIEDWEGNTDWNIINGSQINQWHVGNSIAYGGNQSIYISDNNNTNTYTTNSSSIVHFYKDFYFPSDATNITLKFVYKGYGQSGKDYLKVFLVPTTIIPGAGYDLSLNMPNLQIGGTYCLQNSFATVTINGLDSIAGFKKRLVFSWINDASTGTQSPASIDNIIISYTTTGSGPYLYSWDTSPIQTTATIDNLSAGTYLTTVTDANGCTNTASFNITEPYPVVATITPNGSTTFCEGGTVILTASSATSYLWSNNMTTQNISVSQSGNYSVSITDSNGCSTNSSPTTITVYPLPGAIITPGGATRFCQGGYANLTSSPADSYHWSDGSVTPSINVSTSGDYSVTVTDGNGCTATSQPLTIIVDSFPVATIDTSGSTIFCQGDSVILTASPGTGYLWNYGNTTQSIVVHYTGVYRVAISNSCGTHISSDLYVTTKPSPSAYILTSTSTPLCQGSSVYLYAYSGDSYLWNNGLTTQSIIVTLSGNYYVTVTNNNGCSATSTPQSVYFYPLQNGLSIIVHADTLISPYNRPTYWYLIGNANRVDSGLVHICNQSGNYYVTGFDTNGCLAISDTIFINCSTNDIEASNSTINNIRIYPNPTNNTATITFYLQGQSTVSIHVYDEIGNLIETVLNNKILSGKNSVVFENPLLTNGIYFVKFTTGTRIINKKLVVLK